MYKEQNRPSSLMYKAIGYNDLKRVRIMMEGTDEERRTEALKDLTDPIKILERQTEITNLHYRKFYEDELENNKNLFPENPFLRIPIMRGQSRGLTQSWFSWGSSDKQDESGQLSNEKEVGYFKGRIKVSNDVAEQQFKKDKKYRMDKIMSLIQQIHQKALNKPLEMGLEQITSAESQAKFSNILQTMDIANPIFLEFLKDHGQEEVIRRQLLT